MRLFTVFGLVIGLIMFASSAFAAKKAYVVVYEFPPYYSAHVPKHITGMLVEALNEHQTEYEFVLREVRPSKRYKAITENGCCDLLFFESSVWGWGDSGDYQWGLGLTSSAERFYVLNETVRDNNLHFDYKGANRIGGVHGYNYTFTGNTTDRATLEEQYKLYTANNPMSVLQMLAGKRVDMAILNDDFVSWAQHLGFDGAYDITGSEIVDQEFITKVVVNAHGQLSVAYINELLQELKNNGVLHEILAEFGIAHLIYKDN